MWDVKGDRCRSHPLDPVKSTVWRYRSVGWMAEGPAASIGPGTTAASRLRSADWTSILNILQVVITPPVFLYLFQCETSRCLYGCNDGTFVADQTLLLERGWESRMRCSGQGVGVSVERSFSVAVKSKLASISSHRRIIPVGDSRDRIQVSALLSVR